MSSKDHIIIFLTYVIYTASNLAGSTPYEASIVMGLTAMIFLLNSFRMSFGVYHIATLQFCIFCLASIFWARNYYMAMVKGYTIFQNIVLMTVLYSYYNKLKTIDPLLKVYMWTGYTVLAYCIILYGPARALGLGGFGRLGSTFANINSVGMLVANTIIIHFFFHLFRKKTASILMVIPAILLVTSTQSRKALVALILGVTMLYILKNSKNIKTNLLPILRILIIIVAVVAILVVASQLEIFSGLTNRMNGMIAAYTGEGKADYSSSIRAAMRELGWQQFRETPYLGIGMGNARLLVVEHFSGDSYLHCNYAELAANGGIIGLASYYGIFVYLLWKTFKYIKVETSCFIVITIMITRLINEWGMVSYYSKTTYFLLMVFFIHLEICKKRHPEIK